MWIVLCLLYLESEVVAGSAAWLGRGLSCVCAQRGEYDARPSFDLTPVQEECLQRLQSRIDVPYDSSVLDHQEALKALWNAAFPEEELRGLISEQWKEMGWQGKDPSTDFRGGGYISLENLLFFARNFPKSFQDLLQKREGDRSVWEYPFAVAGVNITFMLIQMLDLEAVKPRTLVGATFLKFLAENDSAFDLLYCIAFKLMDHEWLTMQASYMDFNDLAYWHESVTFGAILRCLALHKCIECLMKSTRCQLERELLSEDITLLEDLPSYTLLAHGKREEETDEFLSMITGVVPFRRSAFIKSPESYELAYLISMFRLAHSLSEWLLDNGGNGSSNDKRASCAERCEKSSDGSGDAREQNKING
ncbi:hypothetical protein SADUNF_Sadunf02G0116300 [Salix dunnii]|uniref:ELMO domain-containing protein n=1 Tax=Salix dunnii TaxID=1413687 RepID=A0A835TGX9_9ROSI|nr:hypothetical protein SADUNF_Sadunf02G0116300 [Salix dunnii]